MQLAADAGAVALFHRTDETFLFAVIKQRGWLRRGIAGGVAEVLSQRRRIDHLARVEEIVRIEGMLNLAKSFIDIGTKHLAVELAACQTIAMLAAHGTAEFQHEIAHLLSDLPHSAYLDPLFQV